MTDAKPTRIGVALTAAQQARMRDLTARLGVQQSPFLCACIEVLSDQEVADIMQRYGELKARQAGETLRARYSVQPTGQ